MVMVGLAAKKISLPLGGDLTTVCPATAPPAPALFSTTTV
jgi:hypothetical protein